MTALEFVKQEMEKAGYTDVEEFLGEQKELHSEVMNEQRWWNDDFVVVEVGGRLIGYMSASTTGDDTPYDKGWEFDETDVCFVEKYEKVVTDYRVIESDG